MSDGSIKTLEIVRQIFEINLRDSFGKLGINDFSIELLQIYLMRRLKRSD